ncbi:MULTISPECIES: nuclear transport factor 2 family protein [unclassified Blastococcus]
MSTPRDIAEACSRHRFRDAYPALAEDVVWTAVGGGPPVRGRQGVADACEATLAALATTTVEPLRVLVVADAAAVAVDTVTRYTDGDEVSVVSSCDVHEFAGGVVTAITSYAVELDPATAPPG